MSCEPMLSLGVRYTVCRVDLRADRLRLFLRDDAGQPFKDFDTLDAWINMRGETLRFAMNAGMYHADLSPVGLFHAEGQQSFALNLADGYGNFFLKPNGVFLVTAAGARVLDSTEYPSLPESPILATQSGPLLARNGVINSKFNPESHSRLIRNGVGVASPYTAIFAISEQPVNFYQFASLFVHDLHCPDALYLDGSISSLYAPELKRDDARANLGPIIGVVQPLPDTSAIAPANAPRGQ